MKLASRYKREAEEQVEHGQQIPTFLGWWMVAIDPGLSWIELREPGEVGVRTDLPAMCAF